MGRPYHYKAKYQLAIRYAHSDLEEGLKVGYDIERKLLSHLFSTRLVNFVSRQLSAVDVQSTVRPYFGIQVDFPHSHPDAIVKGSFSSLCALKQGIQLLCFSNKEGQIRTFGLFTDAMSHLTDFQPLLGKADRCGVAGDQRFELLMHFTGHSVEFIGLHVS